jgi:hypothetical protein
VNASGEDTDPGEEIAHNTEAGVHGHQQPESNTRGDGDEALSLGEHPEEEEECSWLDCHAFPYTLLEAEVRCSQERHARHHEVFPHDHATVAEEELVDLF